MARHQRHPKTGPYEKVNAYTQRPDQENIVALILFLVLLVLHSIFIVPPIVAEIKHPVLIFLLGLHYLLILVIGYDYFYLTIIDPVDSLVEGSKTQQQYQSDKLKKCIICNQNVFVKSYHCMRCNRCTENFDHHCKYLNNCIGSKNYQNFFRILVTLTVYFLNLIGQSIWVFIASFSNQALENYMISKWPVLAIGIVTLLLLLGVDSLLIFHIYLSVIRKMTTLEYIFRETSSNESANSSSSTNSQSQSTEENFKKRDQDL